MKISKAELIGILIAILVAAGFLVWTNSAQQTEKTAKTLQWQMYRNIEYGFEFQYPKIYEILEDRTTEKGVFTLWLGRGFVYGPDLGPESGGPQLLKAVAIRISYDPLRIFTVDQLKKNLID